MNPFIAITSNGGYIGRWCWCNTGAPGNEGLWGSVCLMPFKVPGGWAGCLPIVRYLIR